MSDATLAVTILAWLAYAVSRVLQKRRLPELVAFLLVGAVLGPSALGVIDDAGLASLRPLTRLALAVLMFVIGERVSVRALRAVRWVATAAAAQFVASGVLVFVAVRWAGADDATAVLLAVLAGAGAPMTVASGVSSSRANGSYARALVGTHAAADALAALAFAVALPVAKLLLASDSDVPEALLEFLRLGLGAAVLGLALGWVVARLGTQIETSGELLLFALVHVLVASAVSSLLDLSLPLAALVMGAVASSLAPVEAGQRMFVAVRSIEQPLYLLFFGLAGASIHLDALPELGTVGLAYVGARLLGKLAGATLTGAVTSLPGNQILRLALDLVPQAGVAVGLAVLAAEEVPVAGADTAAVVLGSVVLFELLGPLLVARSMRREEPEAVERRSVGVPEEEPLAVVLVACPGEVIVPAWVVQWCARSGAELCVLGRGAAEDPEVHAAREHLAGDLVPFRWLPLGGESFAGSTIRAAREVGADLVVLGPSGEAPATSRLALRPSERIVRQLDCPVLVLPPR